jgi:hypothetical protein
MDKLDNMDKSFGQPHDRQSGAGGARIQWAAKRGRILFQEARTRTRQGTSKPRGGRNDGRDDPRNGGPRDPFLPRVKPDEFDENLCEEFAERRPAWQRMKEGQRKTVRNLAELFAKNADEARAELKADPVGFFAAQEETRKFLEGLEAQRKRWKVDT